MGKYFYYLKCGGSNDLTEREGEGYPFYYGSYGTVRATKFYVNSYTKGGDIMNGYFRSGLAPVTFSFYPDPASTAVRGRVGVSSFESDEDFDSSGYNKCEFVQITGKFKLKRLTTNIAISYFTALYYPCEFEYRGNRYLGITTCTKTFYTSSEDAQIADSCGHLTFISGDISITDTPDVTVITDTKNILVGDIDNEITFSTTRIPVDLYNILLKFFDEVYPYTYSVYGANGNSLYTRTDSPAVKHIKFSVLDTLATIQITGTNDVVYEGTWTISPSTEGTKFLGLSFVKNAKRPSIPIGYDQDITIDGNLELYEVFGRDYTPTKTFEMNIYKNSAESNRVDKTNQLVFVDTLNGVLRESSSIAEPVFNISASDVPQFNYVYIPAFNRYYFVVELTSMNYNLWRLSLKCDVLMTYKDGIKALNAFVERNESQFDENIVDKLRPIEEGYDVQSTEIPNNLFGNLSIADKYIVVTGAGITIEEEE